MTKAELLDENDQLLSLLAEIQASTDLPEHLEDRVIDLLEDLRNKENTENPKNGA